ncbi:MAG: hypothetical protein QOD41_1213, partial [Cryptosporangiaceae bacterium]|nr:hypothetical protein [Cryptosporangiaceae bacterium]
MTISPHSGAQPPTRIRRLTILAAVTATLAGGAVALLAEVHSASAATSGRSVFDVPSGYGATVPFTEYEAESGATNGTTIGPDLTRGSLGSEASGRTAVKLAAQGQYVEFTLRKPANAVDISVALDQGKAGSLSAYVNGTRTAASFDVHGKYTHISSNIGGSPPVYHLYNDYRIRLGTDAPAGAKVRVQIDATDTGGAPYYVDVADFEQVGAALPQPAGSVSVVSNGADPTGAADSTSAFVQTINSAAGRTVWVPAGKYRVGSLVVNNGVTLRGAGPWYTEITAINPSNALFSAESQSGTLHLSDFTAFGQVAVRNDSEPSNFVHGGLGAGGSVSNVWIQNFKVGLWLVHPSNQNIVIENNRMLDFLADGVNFNGYVQNGTIRNNFLRNQGDDSLAIWSIHSPVQATTFANNTIVEPNLANGIGIYGGIDTTLSKNVIADTNGLGSGIDISNQEFVALNFQILKGTITVAGNYLIRTGMLNPNWGHPMSAIRIDSNNYPIGDGVQVNVTDNTFWESPYSVIQLVSGNGQGLPIRNVTVNGAVVEGAGTVVLQAETQGTASFSNVTATGVGAAGVYNCVYPANSGTFTPVYGSGNSGWSSVWPGCAFPPRSDTPGSPPPSSSPPPSQDPNGNLAAGRPVTVSSEQGGFPGSKATDGSADSYWESANNAFPQSLTVDLGSAKTVGKLVLKLPPNPAWDARTETLSIAGSTDGSTFTTVKPPAGYAFSPATGNTVTVALPAGTSARYLRLLVTGNTGWPAAQFSEVEAYAAGGTQPGPPPAGNLALGAATSETSHVQGYSSIYAVDGDAGTYWES